MAKESMNKGGACKSNEANW